MRVPISKAATYPAVTSLGPSALMAARSEPLPDSRCMHCPANLDGWPS